MIPTMPGRMYTVIHRFEATDFHGYQAATMPDAPIRNTPEQAIEDELRWTKGDR